MKKLALFSLLLSAVITACSPKVFTINGTVPAQFDGKWVYLVDCNTDKATDNSKIAAGKFSFSGSVETPAIYRLSIQDTYVHADLIVENLPIEVDFSDQMMRSIKADGYNAQYAKLIKQISDFNDYAAGVMDSMQRVYPDDMLMQSLTVDSLLMPLYFAINEEYRSEMKANADNIYGVLCAWKASDYATDDIATELNALIAIVPKLAEFGPVKKNLDKYEAAKQTSAGAMFKDFAAKTVDGKPVKLSDHVGRGQYVLVDFWASWCAPCMEEVENLKVLRAAYPELMIVGVNVWDKHDAFVETIDKKGMTWTCLYASDDKTATDLYGIMGIPTVILFGPDGTIIARDHNSAVLEESIANIFEK